MAVLIECLCHRKQSTKNKLCTCGQDLVKLKRSRKVNYWITYRLPGGKQRFEKVKGEEGSSIEYAKDAEAKRKVQKRENRIFDIKPETRMTFKELANWYLNLEKVKSLKSYSTKTINLNNFNAVFGSTMVSQIKPVDLENYQAKRKAEGRADKTIDDQIASAKAMINKASDNDMVSRDILKPFQKVKKMLKTNSNARDRILSPGQFKQLLENLPLHAKWFLATGFYTGMRRGEIASLTWDRVFLKERFIQLEAKHTKDNEPRRIPICDELHNILKGIPRSVVDSHVFLYQGKPISDIRMSLEIACKKADIPYGRFVKDGLIFHDLRHTFNTYMRKAGVQESVIMEMTGHATREMFDRYNTIDADDQKEAIKKFESFLKGNSANVYQSVDQDEKTVSGSFVSH